MKGKITMLLLAALLLATGMQEQFRRGDVNGDLLVDVADISTILSIMAGEGGGYQDSFVQYGKEYRVAIDGSGDYTSLPHHPVGHGPVIRQPLERPLRRDDGHFAVFVREVVDTAFDTPSHHGHSYGQDGCFSYSAHNFFVGLFLL